MKIFVQTVSGEIALVFHLFADDDFLVVSEKSFGRVALLTNRTIAVSRSSNRDPTNKIRSSSPI